VIVSKAVRRLAPIALLLSACAHYSQDDGEKLANEVYGHSTQLQALQKSLKDSQKTIDRQDEQLGDLRSEVDTMSKAARRNDADLGVQVDELMQQTAQLKGLVETFRDRMEKAEAEVVRLTEESKIGMATSEEEKTKAIEAARERERVLSNPEALTEEVKRLMAAKSYEEARGMLLEFGQRAKDDKRLGRWADDAQFLIGETFFAEEDYKRAATEFNAVRKKFPKSKKVPEALYKMGLCFERLKLPEDAGLFYQTLRKQYPKSKAAKRARKRLKALRK